MNKAISILIPLFALTACGGGSGGSGGSDQETTFTVSAHNGVVQVDEFSATFFSGDNADTVTSQTGEFSRPSEPTDFSIAVNAGVYTEEISGEEFSISPGSLNGFYRFSDSRYVITPFTTWASCAADFLINVIGDDRDVAFESTENRFIEWLGFNIFDTTPTSPADVTTESVTNEIMYGYLIAALSDLTAQVSVNNGALPHATRLFSTINLVELGCSDFQADGVLDGIGLASESNPTGQLFIGNTALDTEFYRLGIAESVLNVANNTALNQSPLTVSDFLDLAYGFTDNVSVWRTIGRAEVDNQAPNVTTNDVENAIFSGLTRFLIQANDLTEVASLTVSIDDILLGTTTSNQLEIDVDTSMFQDGQHELSVISEDILGNTATFTEVFETINFGAALEITSPILTADRDYTITGNFVSRLLPLDRIEVNGQLATVDFNTNTFQTTISLPNFTQNTLEVVAFDVGGNTTRITFDVERDGITPQIALEGTNVLFGFVRDSASLFNLCEREELFAARSESFPICLRESFISLNGNSIPAVNSTFSLGINYTDNRPLSELQLDYRYEREGEGVIVDWTPVFRVDFPLDFTYLPLTIEFLGDDFYTFGEEQLHTISVRAIDRVGNERIRSIPLRFRFFPGI